MKRHRKVNTGKSYFLAEVHSRLIIGIVNLIQFLSWLVSKLNRNCTRLSLDSRLRRVVLADLVYAINAC